MKAMYVICIAIDIISAVMYAKGILQPTKSSAVSRELLMALMWLAFLLK